MRRASVIASLVLSAVAPLLAQSSGPLPPLTAHVDVNIVNVDVTVTDRAGRPIMDLTKDDFELFEDGHPMKVTNFYVIANAAVKDNAPAPASQAAPGVSANQLRRKVVLLIDNNYIDRIERNRAILVMEKQVQKAFVGDYEFAVAAIGHTLQIVQPFTADRTVLHDALQKVSNMETLVGHHDMDRAILSDRTRKNLDFQTDGYDYSETVRFSSRESTFRAVSALQNTARAVVDMARAHTADEGKKYMILLTGGMENNTSYGAYDKSSDRELRELKTERAQIMDAIVREANSANFTIHVINARAHGMAAPQHDVENRSSGIDMSSPNFFQRGGGSDPIDVSDVDSLPLTIALNTGGVYMPSNDIAHSLGVIDAQTSNFYSLGYSPEHSGDRLYHRIGVKVKRTGVIVANRVGYLDLSPDDRLEQKLKARTTFEEPTGTLPVVVDLGAPHYSDSRIVLPVTAEVPLAKLTMLPRDGSHVGRVHVYLSVFDRLGRNVGFHHQLQEVTTMDDHSLTPFRYTMNVRLGKGTFTVVITLRDDLSNEVGSAMHDVTL